MKDLTGRVAIITGAGKGLGRAYALALATHGAAIVVNNRRHPGERDEDTSASKVVSEIRAHGGQAVASFDAVERADAGQAMVDTALKAFGQIDIVIANAAVPQAMAFHKLTNVEFHRIFDVSFLGTLHLVQAAWPILRQQGYGRVITTTSSAGRPRPLRLRRGQSGHRSVDSEPGSRRCRSQHPRQRNFPLRVFSDDRRLHVARNGRMLRS